MSILVGTCSADLAPDCVRGVGVRVWPGACQLTVLVPVAVAATAIANLRENPNIAITQSHIPTYRTIQIKGTVREIRDGSDDDHRYATSYRDRFARDLAWAGLGRGHRLGVRPVHAIDVEIAVVFSQTPGPVAGVKMPVPEGQR